jgi:outer membrane protein
LRPINPNFIQVKKTFTRFVVLALVAVVAYSCGNKSESTSTDSSSMEGAAAGDLKIAYVHTDSVINKYDFFKKKSEEITEKGKKLDLDLQSRAKGFEQEVALFQQTGGSMTQNQIRDAKRTKLAQLQK